MAKKSMSLDQFKAAIETDASKRVDAQAATIKALQAKIAALTSEIEEKNTWIHQLENRCKVQSQGMLCWFCGMRRKCHAVKVGAYE